MPMEVVTRKDDAPERIRDMPERTQLLLALLRRLHRQRRPPRLAPKSTSRLCRERRSSAPFAGSPSAVLQPVLPLKNGKKALH